MFACKLPDKIDSNIGSRLPFLSCLCPLLRAGVLNRVSDHVRYREESISPGVQWTKSN